MTVVRRLFPRVSQDQDKVKGKKEYQWYVWKTFLVDIETSINNIFLLYITIVPQTKNLYYYS